MTSAGVVELPAPFTATRPVGGPLSLAESTGTRPPSAKPSLCAGIVASLPLSRTFFFVAFLGGCEAGGAVACESGGVMVSPRSRATRTSFFALEMPVMALCAGRVHHTSPREATSGKAQHDFPDNSSSRPTSLHNALSAGIVSLSSSSLVDMVCCLSLTALCDLLAFGRGCQVESS